MQGALGEYVHRSAKQLLRIHEQTTTVAPRKVSQRLAVGFD